MLVTQDPIYGDPVGYALNNKNFSADEEKDNDFKCSFKTKEQVCFHGRGLPGEQPRAPPPRPWCPA